MQVIGTSAKNTKAARIKLLVVPEVAVALRRMVEAGGTISQWWLEIKGMAR